MAGQGKGGKGLGRGLEGIRRQGNFGGEQKE